MKTIFEKTSGAGGNYVGIVGNEQEINALEQFIPVLLEKGYKFVVISELIGN